MIYDDDADLSVVQQRNVAVLGYGSQGHAHALSLRDSGVDVRVGLLEGSRSRAKAEAEGLRVVTPFEACEEADLVVVLAPDSVQRTLYAGAIEPNRADGRPPLCTGGAPAAAVVLAPDAGQRTLSAEAIEPNLVDGDALFFSHGFNIRYGYIKPPPAWTSPWWHPRGRVTRFVVKVGR